MSTFCRYMGNWKYGSTVSLT